ncbi:LamG domain-containing protein [Glycomyces paridis]|uniref:LamG domain-containing protein n=1 Tax=Glycomyces paridis TaxID=2126555 RepID=A0A4S8PKX1_9ACTN|nr:LamG domain-containing protein [Glycomyces paridis]THV31398.1 LamG domain-containing protein [Glycomyces paridis]
MSIIPKRALRGLLLAALAGVVAAAGLATPAAAAPSAPVITSDDFPSDDFITSPMVGEIGTITITAADPDIAYYIVDFSRDDKGPEKIVLDPPSEPVELAYMPTISGRQVLNVRAVSTTGGAVDTYYTFLVSAKAPVGAWALAEPTGSAQVLDANGLNPGKVGNGVQLGAEGPGDATAASFDGTSRAFVNTADKDLLRTDEGFAVSAWVRVDDLARDQAAVSLKSAEESGFVLGYHSLSATSGEWTFATPDAKRDPTGSWQVSGGSVWPGTADEWVQLTGVYNQVDQSIALYVNGVAVDTAVRETTWNASGDVQIGRALADDEWGLNWSGDLAEIQVFDRFVATGEVEDLVTHPLFTREGYWQFNTAPDGLSPEYLGGESAVLHGDASILVEGDPFFDPFPIAGTGNLLLDGDGDYATLDAPLVDTSGSFSVTAVVQLEGDHLDEDMTVFSIPGEHRPLAEVRYDATDYAWKLVLATADDPEAATVELTSRVTPVTFQPQGIAVVFDGSLGQWNLYVGGNASAGAVSEGIEPWTAAGGLEIGRSRTGGGSSYFAGGIDELRVYTGAISDYVVVAAAMAYAEDPGI